jgi:hypothetical protein
MLSLWARIRIDAIEVSHLGRIRLIACLALACEAVRFDGCTVCYRGARYRCCSASYRKAKQMAPPNGAAEVSLHSCRAPDLISGSIDRVEPALTAIIQRRLRIMSAMYFND